MFQMTFATENGHDVGILERQVSVHVKLAWNSFRKMNKV